MDLLSDLDVRELLALLKMMMMVYAAVRVLLFGSPIGLGCASYLVTTGNRAWILGSGDPLVSIHVEIYPSDNVAADFP